MSFEEFVNAVIDIKKEDYELFIILKSHVERLKHSHKK